MVFAYEAWLSGSLEVPRGHRNVKNPNVKSSACWSESLSCSVWVQALSIFGEMRDGQTRSCRRLERDAADKDTFEAVR